MKSEMKTYVALHFLLMLYSVSGIVSKFASRQSFFSKLFLFQYGLSIMIMAFYAIGWQQFVKRMPLSAAYANKAVTVIWGCIWGVLFFNEHLSPGKLIGCLMVLAGVALYGYTEGKTKKEADE